jgi:hypothetical protein
LAEGREPCTFHLAVHDLEENMLLRKRVLLSCLCLAVASCTTFGQSLPEGEPKEDAGIPDAGPSTAGGQVGTDRPK